MPAAPAEPRRLTLAERRKAETRMDIARTAARLFAERGTAAVTAEEIAAESGVALRTFYRYCRTKEDAVEPMLAAGAQRWLRIIATGPQHLPSLAELEAAAVRALTFEGVDEDLEVTRGLLRAMDTDDALRAVWHRINLEGERELRLALAELAGKDADTLQIRLIAAAIAGSIRIAVEQWASTNAPATGKGSPADLVIHCIRTLGAGL
ncbi:TetR/AcrR family transcriptional regulator [Nocardia huaxiensis]|uniref:TetR/AcrR family transcriptional regulator n=1 Tax=Nocardia huaxiensis TaxID=2755382 RepID=UPI001E4F746A|nr:TetR/AcrR family transcriptional regulator [Nocardia huaxiensis]UFS96405.1 TetR/AcrR family transcriptional regulator [Nocardia huaxiensis]